jgi:hypothetical protein
VGAVTAVLAVLLRNLIAFFATRIRGLPSARSIPSFIWVPISVAMSAIATFLTVVGAIRGPDAMWLHDVGWGMILQGLFAGLVVGIGAMLVPVSVGCWLSSIQRTPIGGLARLLLSSWLQLCFGPRRSSRRYPVPLFISRAAHRRRPGAHASIAFGSRFAQQALRGLERATWRAAIRPIWMSA